MIFIIPLSNEWGHVESIIILEFKLFVEIDFLMISQKIPFRNLSQMGLALAQSISPLDSL